MMINLLRGHFLGESRNLCTVRFRTQIKTWGDFRMALSLLLEGKRVTSHVIWLYDVDTIVLA